MANDNFLYIGSALDSDYSSGTNIIQTINIEQLTEDEVKWFGSNFEQAKQRLGIEDVALDQYTAVLVHYVQNQQDNLGDFLAYHGAREVIIVTPQSQTYIPKKGYETVLKITPHDLSGDALADRIFQGLR